MNIVLQDSSGQNWLVGVDSTGRATTKAVTSGAGTPVTLLLQDANSVVWQISVDTRGRLVSTATILAPSPSYLSAEIDDSKWNLIITTGGQVQTFSPFSGWVPNGGGAGTDNSVVGGLGGFMAYPQPPNPVGIGPEADGQFGALAFVYDSSTPQGKGNQFVLFNPGRN
jgi:hypothetical protein